MAQNRHEIEGAFVFPPLDQTHSFLETLTNGVTGPAVVQHLMAQRQTLGSWFVVAESLATVLGEMGRSWVRGELTVIQEHIASERLTRALSQCAERIEFTWHREAPVPEPLETADLEPLSASFGDREPVTADGPPTCMLMVAEGDDHTLGLHLVELCLREAGWNVIWAGRRMPVHAVCDHILASPEIDMLAVSASEFSRDAAALADQATRLGQACQKRDIPMLLGGMGAWPEQPVHGHRLRTFNELSAWLNRSNAH